VVHVNVTLASLATETCEQDEISGLPPVMLHVPVRGGRRAGGERGADDDGGARAIGNGELANRERFVDAGSR
jgi:hypothetical protein